MQKLSSFELEVQPDINAGEELINVCTLGFSSENLQRMVVQV